MSNSQDTSRLDLALVERGLAPTRARARDAIERGQVTVDDVPAQKPGQRITGAMKISIGDDSMAYVSRSALKLKHGLDHFLFDVAGLTALDLGASTGGFTQVLLERGAARVYAVDVGTDQLHGAIREDPRVVALAGVNARALDDWIIDRQPELIVADMSFISLTKALGPALGLAAARARLIALIKPQFELERGDLSKGGIVRQAAKQRQACEKVIGWIDSEAHWQVIGVEPSPIRGGDGNREFLVGALNRDNGI